MERPLIGDETPPPAMEVTLRKFRRVRRAAVDTAHLAAGGSPILAPRYGRNARSALLEKRNNRLVGIALGVDSRSARFDEPNSEACGIRRSLSWSLSGRDFKVGGANDR